MRLEQRGRVKLLYLEFNWRQEETLECNEIVTISKGMIGAFA